MTTHFTSMLFYVYYTVYVGVILTGDDISSINKKNSFTQFSALKI